MKSIFLSSLGAVLLAAYAPKSSAASLLIDDFSSGSFSFESGGTTTDSRPLTTALTDQRVITGIGFADWTATLVTNEVVYNVNQPSLPGRNYLKFIYAASSGSFSILGYSAFSLDVSGVTGSGELIATVSGSNGSDIRIPFNSDTTIISPFSNLDTSQSLDSLSQLNFRIRALSGNFSATIDNIKLVPEPSSVLLAVFGCSWLLIRRRR